ncbi:MAG: 2-oxoacid:ferredoxin oxidoreductase subunit beta [Candidatus Kapabacteria bacterium]|nr:2-oxoacid:ferredoxin oxidoreductase subunit beta [Candidatus Kapabacteria bacterium]MDW8012418.1 2-oxoacid:ferredoxin oxidoreductase subunit beta [Bacteroidota bacterium]
MTEVLRTALSAKDYASDQEVRWCPGCGDYAILKQVQTVLAELEVPRENVVFISGIGCSSRFPYYMGTYGLHGIHGRAPAIAYGLKITRPELHVWIVTGDGDGLSIGGNHLIHMLRRNMDVTILLFNNEVYGLTKGQISPTSRPGQRTPSTPWGSFEHPFNPVALAFGAGATFVARTMDRDLAHMRSVLKRAAQHRGAAFVEIYQNCPVFNDGAFFAYTEKESKPENALFVEHGQPLVFGQNRDKGFVLEGMTPRLVDFSDGLPENVWIHDETDRTKAALLVQLLGTPDNELPRPFGVLYADPSRPTYEELLAERRQRLAQRHPADLEALLRGKNWWGLSS